MPTSISSTAALDAPDNIVVHDSFQQHQDKGSSISTALSDHLQPLVANFDNNNHGLRYQKPECKPKIYFGGYTLFEVFCILLIALSGLSILTLLLAWGPITTIQLKYWKESDNAFKKNDQQSSIVQDTKFLIMSDMSSISSNQDTDTYFSNSNDGIESEESNEIVHIKSANDFSQIDETTKTLKIELLMDKDINISNLFSKNISSLELLGPISTEGLETILMQFTHIQYLFVDVDNSCTRYPNNNNLPSITLRKLMSVFVKNSDKCQIFDWAFNLQTPKLTKFKSVDTILTQDNFNMVKQFLSNAQNTLEEIEITRSFICKDCDISDIQYDNLTKMTVNQRRTQPTLSGTIF